MAGHERPVGQAPGYGQGGHGQAAPGRDVGLYDPQDHAGQTGRQERSQ